MERALVGLKAGGVAGAPDVPLFDFDEFCRLIGFEQVWDFDRRWAR